MGLTHFPHGVSSFGIPLIGSVPTIIGNADYLFVDGGSQFQGDGRSADSPFRTFGAAISVFQAQSPRRPTCIIGAPGDYNESLVVTRENAGSNDDAGAPLVLVGAGPLGSVSIAPSTAASEALENREDNVSLINIGLAAPDDGDFALRNFGARLRAYLCKIEGAATAGAALLIGPGTDAQVNTAFTHGDGADSSFFDCEFCWAFDAIRIAASDFGALTQTLFNHCRFHNFSNSAFEETGGSANIRFRNLQLVDCFFDDQEGGTPPTKYLSLNDDNANDGIVTRCSFPTAINSGLNLVSTALHWVSNYHTGGISTAQPS